MGAIDKCEVVFEAVENFGVRTEQLLAVRDDCFEHTSPPRQPQLGFDDVPRDNASGEGGEQRLESFGANAIGAG